jgi:hypothetical protein
MVLQHRFALIRAMDRLRPGVALEIEQDWLYQDHVLPRIMD